MKKKTWIIIIVAIIIIFIIYRIVKMYNKKPNTGTSGTGVSTGNPKETADRLYELMNGLTIYPSSRKEVEETLTQVSNSSNADFTAVWNAFGNRDGNLAEWAKDEYYVDNSISDAIQNRATQLGLK